MLRPGDHRVTLIGVEHQMPLDVLQRDRPERQVLDRDLQLFDRRDQMIAVRVLPQHRREQPRQFGPADGRALMHPDAIGLDDNVDVTAMLGMPQMHRRQAATALFLGQLRQRVQTLCLLVCHPPDLGPATPVAKSLQPIVTEPATVSAITGNHNSRAGSTGPGMVTPPVRAKPNRPK